MNSRVSAMTAALIRACAVLAVCVCGLGLLSNEARASCGDHLQSPVSFRDGWRIAPTDADSGPRARCNGPHCQERPAAPLPQPEQVPRIQVTREQFVAAVGLSSDTARDSLSAGRHRGETVQALPGFAEALERPPC
jgi:hypothetical protein